MPYFLVKIAKNGNFTKIPVESDWSASVSLARGEARGVPALQAGRPALPSLSNQKSHPCRRPFCALAQDLS